MSHPVPGQEYEHPCQIPKCKNIAVDSVNFEAGNNAEFPVNVNLCEQHLEELENLGYGFEQKYGSTLDELAYERLRGQEDWR